MRCIFVALTIYLLCSMAAADSTSRQPDCSERRINSLRREVENLHTAKNFKAVTEKISAFEDDCYSELFISERNSPSQNLVDGYFWIQSDALLAELKSNAFSACLRRGRQITRSYYQNPFLLLNVEKRSAGKALRHNLSMCEEAWKKKFVVAENTRCNLATDKTSAPTIELPESMLPKQSAMACLQLITDFEGSVQERDKEELDTSLCPRVRLLSKGTNLTNTESVDLIAKDGALSRCDFTCGLRQLSLVEHQQETLVHVSGTPKSCTGGTASIEYEGVYRWQGGALELVEELIVPLH
jgi:hypothetical protein